MRHVAFFLTTVAAATFASNSVSAQTAAATLRGSSDLDNSAIQ